VTPTELRTEFYSRPADALVDRATAAAVFYLTAASFEAMAIKGGGPPYRCAGRRVLYVKADLLAWYQQHAVVHEKPAGVDRVME